MVDTPPSVQVPVTVAEISDEVQFWSDELPEHDALEDSVRETLDRIQYALERQAFLGTAEEPIGSLILESFEVATATPDLLVVVDSSGTGWTNLFTTLKIEDRTTRRIIRSLHARVAARETGVVLDGCLVFRKPHWANYPTARGIFAGRTPPESSPAIK